MFKKSLLSSKSSGSRIAGIRSGGAIATAAVLALGLAACGGPSSGAPSSESSEAKTLRVGFMVGYPTGYSNSVAQEVFEGLGYKVEMVPLAFEALIPSLQSGRIDAASGGLYITPSRCKVVTFAEPTKYYMNSMAVKKGNPHNLKTLEDIAKEGITMGVPSGSDISRQAVAAGVKESQISVFQDINTMLQAVQTGRVEAAPYDHSTLGPELKKPGYGDLQETDPYNPTFDDGVQRPYASGIAFPKDQTDLAKKYSEKQAELFKNDREKLIGYAEAEGNDEAAVPKSGDPYTTADYCAHAGT